MQKRVSCQEFLAYLNSCTGHRRAPPVVFYLRPISRSDSCAIKRKNVENPRTTGFSPVVLFLKPCRSDGNLIEPVRSRLRKKEKPGMPKNNFDQFDLLEEVEELDGSVPVIRNAPRRFKRSRLKDEYNLITEPEVASALFAQADDRRTFNFTYQASETEAEWLTDSIGGFFEGQWFDDVLQIVKGGKEASVYQLKGNATTGVELLAAKVYRPRIFRALRNDHIYKEGRSNLDEDGLIIKNEGKLKAIRQRSGYGERLIHTSWIEHEVRTMQRLSEAGCDVPRFYASGERAILMSFIGDKDMAAPTLNTVSLPLDEAHDLYQRTLKNIRLMLGCERIHGDLSAFNILYWQGEITLIDFPQAIHPDKNRSAYTIFLRDVIRVCEYFQRQGVRTNPHLLAENLWREAGRRVRPDLDPRLLDPEDVGDRALWEKFQ